jgi:hypothetical protein
VNPPPWQTVEILTRLVKSMPIRAAFEYHQDSRTWTCSLRLRDHHVEGLGADLPEAVFDALLTLVGTMNAAEQEES